MSSAKNTQITETKGRSGKKNIIKYFLITFIIVIAVGLGCLALLSSILDIQLFNKEQTSDTSVGTLIPAEGMFASDPEFTKSKRVNVLLLGTTGEQLTDTIMVVSYDQETRHIDIISVPRDTYHEKEGYTEPATKKINAAYWGDPVSSAHAVHEVLQGIPINYYAVIDYDGVANIVDAIGGVEVDVPIDMDYEKPSEDPPLIIHLKAGTQTLNGEDAVSYLRYRYDYKNGDYGRVNAQQDFVKRAIKQSIGLNLPRVAKAVVENIDSDIDLKKVVSLASDVGNVDMDAVNTYVLPGNPDYYENLAFYFCDMDQTEEMLRAMYSGQSFESTTSAITGPDDPNYREWNNIEF